MDNAFQNWTRTSAEILGTGYFHADYTAPIEEIQSQLKKVLDNTPLWDGRVWGLVVTDAKEQTIELRALVSAEDSSKAWDLRCHVREQMITYLRQNYPNSLPKLRAATEPLISGA